uniref:Uncharacterized protein n=1 Tax=Pseudictyota dubia TaxID=2749911 RepID=A0A7R9VMQ9_9STRA|mmetsp:Transcript_18086/g.33690  ORF Transcript_18086/g.33690 Transcript_18086/m.33690 type:complete len:183 (+) Transcript_18086:163-711(+)
MAMVGSPLAMVSDKSLESSDNDDARGKAYAFRCAENRQWGNLRDLLLRPESAQLGSLEDVDADGRTLLHVVCSNEPPLDVVKSVTNRFPTMTDATDDARRTPLHEAVSSGASTEVVKFLVESGPECTTRKDADGKTPLVLVTQEIGRIDDELELRHEDELEIERRLLYLCDLAESLVPLAVH